MSRMLQITVSVIKRTGGDLGTQRNCGFKILFLFSSVQLFVTKKERKIRKLKIIFHKGLETI